MIQLTKEEAQQVLDALGSCEEDWIPDGEWETRIDQYDHKLVAKALEILRARLVEPEKEQEPVAYDVQKALYRAYVLGQKYWADADSESYSRNKRADKHRQDFETLCEEALFCTAPPKRPWVGLTDEEVQYLWGRTTPDDLMSGGFDFADAIEAKLKEKNR